MNFDTIKKHNPTKILDIGGHTGEFYNLCKNNLNIVDYFLIEGNSNCEEDIKKLNVPYMITLVGKEDGIVEFFKTKEDSKSTGNSIYRENTRHFSDENVIISKEKILTLDTIFKNKNKNFDLLKIDTQGSELDILEGGKTIFLKCELIIMETSLIEYNKNAPLQKDIIGYMLDNNFTPIEILENHHFSNGDLIQQDILFLNKK